jgi:hypothetical protein
MAWSDPMMAEEDNRAMQANSNNGRRSRLRFIVICALALVLVASAALLIINSSHSSPNFPKADQEQSTIFQGMSAFINNGLTTEQVNELIQSFSKFTPTAKTVSIDPASLTPGPHDPNKINPFTINFNASIDSSPYKGTVSYTDLSSIRLILYSSSGKQAFDSGTISN